MQDSSLKYDVEFWLFLQEAEKAELGQLPLDVATKLFVFIDTHDTVIISEIYHIRDTLGNIIRRNVENFLGTYSKEDEALKISYWTDTPLEVRRSNLMGLEVRSMIEHEPPFSYVKTLPSGKLHIWGIHMDIMDVMGRFMNFTLFEITRPPNRDWGIILEELTEKRIDFALGNFGILKVCSQLRHAMFGMLIVISS